MPSSPGRARRKSRGDHGEVKEGDGIAVSISPVLSGILPALPWIERSSNGLKGGGLLGSGVRKLAVTVGLKHVAFETFELKQHPKWVTRRSSENRLPSTS